jgi:hypothetical protein
VARPVQVVTFDQPVSKLNYELEKALRLKMMTQQVLTSLQHRGEYTDKAEDVSRSKSREKPDENVGYESFDGIAKKPAQPASQRDKANAKNKPQDTAEVRPVTKKAKIGLPNENPRHNFRQSVKEPH